jgi:GTP-binding protein
MLWQSGVFRQNAQVVERVMDSLSLERERGITILRRTRRSTTRARASTSSILPATPTSEARWSGRSRWWTASCCLVDASEGPLPQTRFVLKKALERTFLRSS